MTVPVVRVLSAPNGHGLRISGPKLCGCCPRTIVEIQPEELTARERHDLQARAALARRDDYPDADWLEEMVDRAYRAQNACGGDAVTAAELVPNYARLAASSGVEIVSCESLDGPGAADGFARLVIRRRGRTYIGIYHDGRQSWSPGDPVEVLRYDGMPVEDLGRYPGTVDGRRVRRLADGAILGPIEAGEPVTPPEVT